MEQDALPHADPYISALPPKSLQNPLPSTAALSAPQPSPLGGSHIREQWEYWPWDALGVPGPTPEPGCWLEGLCLASVESWPHPPGPPSSPSLSGVSLRKGLYQSLLFICCISDIHSLADPGETCPHPHALAQPTCTPSTALPPSHPQGRTITQGHPCALNLLGLPTISS